VTIEGTRPKRPTGNQLVNASKLQLGASFTQEKLDRAVSNLQVVLADNGYYQAQIRATEDYHIETQQVDIAFHLVPGNHARIGVVRVTGDAGFTPREVEKFSDISTGHTVTVERLRNGLAALRKRYQKLGRLEAQVAVANRLYHPETNLVDYVLDIQRGPTVDVRIEGAKLSRGKIKKYVPVYEEGAVDDDLLNEGSRNLRNYFETQGYFDVAINYERRPELNHVDVVYKVNQGEKHKVVEIGITVTPRPGAKTAYFPGDVIRDTMQVRTRSGLLSHGFYSDDLLARDAQMIASLYRNNGFAEAKVTHRVLDDYQGEIGALAVRIEIDEGPQTLIHSVILTGNRAVPDAPILGLLQSTEGQPFSDLNVATDRDAVESYYFNQGFPDVQVQASAKAVPDQSHLRDVVFTIQEGAQVFVDRILVSGLHYTRPSVVQRQIELQSGEPLSQIGMLDTQRRLYDLGLFNEVDTAVQNPEGHDPFKNALIDLREAKRWTFNYGFGFEFQTGQPAATQFNTAPAPGVKVPPGTTPPQSGVLQAGNPQGGFGFSPRVSFGVTRLNFRGRDHTLTLSSHLGSLQKRGLISYDAPHYWNRDNLRMTLTAFYDNSRDVGTFTATRIEGSGQIQQVLNPVNQLLYGFTYRRVSVDAATLAINPNLIPLLSRPVNVGIPSFTWIRDKRRPDPLDPQRGNYTTIDTGYAARTFGGTASFGRLVAQNSTYSPIKKKFVVARETRIGVEQPIGNQPAAAAIPLPERFFAGGPNSLRAFGLNQAGPRDLLTGFPLGGNAEFINIVEVRFPPPELPYVGSNLSFAIFHDFGNVFESSHQMLHSLGHWDQPKRAACASEATSQACRFDYISQAVGTGIRYRTPIGPVRLDLSYSLNPPTFPFFVQCPAAGGTGQCANKPSALLFQAATLRHFNFFFSIGQSF
jgi:outer membrane protein insertion porin family